MRPLPVTPFEGAPGVVLGLAVIRGEVVPVLDAGLLAGDGPVRPGRFVTVKSGGRTAALAVEGVLGIRAIDRASLAGLPPLLAREDPDVVRAVSPGGDGLLFVLDGARLLPDEVWKLLEAAREAS